MASSAPPPAAASAGPMTTARVTSQPQNTAAPSTQNTGDSTPTPPGPGPAPGLLRTRMPQGEPAAGPHRTIPPGGQVVKPGAPVRSGQHSSNRAITVMVPPPQPPSASSGS